MIRSIIVLLVSSCCLSFAKAEVIEDVLGRKVDVELPAKRVVLGFYAEDYIAIGTEKALDNVVGISRDTWAVWRPASWALYTAYRPSLKEISDVGEVESQTFSVEKVIALKPSVLLLANWQYQGLGFDAERIEEAGIPIVVVDYNEQTLERHLKSTQIIGLLTGQQQRAQQIASEYQSTLDDVKNRVLKAQQGKPRVYIEFGNKGPSEYSFTYGKNMWGAIAAMAGGDNIAAPFVEWWGPLNPEQVLASKPEVIILSGTESGKSNDALLMGQGVARATATERLQGFTERAGWNELPAVKSERIFGVYHGASRSILDASAIQYVAKALYPEAFKDVNPEQAYLDFYKQYLPVEPQGTFFVALD